MQRRFIDQLNSKSSSAWLESTGIKVEQAGIIAQHIVNCSTEKSLTFSGLHMFDQGFNILIDAVSSNKIFKSLGIEKIAFSSMDMMSIVNLLDNNTIEDFKFKSNNLCEKVLSRNSS